MAFTALIASVISIFDPSPAPVDPLKRPVVLVHGIYCDGADMGRLAKHLRAEGRQVFAPSLKPSGGGAPLEMLAAQLDEYVRRKLPAGQEFDLVGFSMGGLISRYYVQRLGGLERVHHFITLATPHHGTKMALLQKSPGALQMRPGSAFLKDLERDADSLRKVKFTSFYTPLDTIIVPARSSELPQARNVRMWATIHPSWILEKRCLRAVSAALRE